MGKFADGFQFAVTGHFFLEVVLHGLYVVVGGTFDILDTLCVLEGKILGNIVEELAGMFAEGGNFTNRIITRQ